MSISLREKTILVTREKKQAKEFSEKILRYGGKPIEVPLLKISCKDLDENEGILRRLSEYKWIFFTSANGVDCFFQLMNKYGLCIDVIASKLIAAVGHKTENALKQYGFTADFIPTIYDADTMAREFLATYKTEGSMLLVRGNRSRNVLPEEFSKIGIEFDTIEVYEATYNDGAEKKLNNVLNEQSVDFLTFTSPSTVEAFCKMKSKLQTKPQNKKASICVCIGTTTERRARELGFTNILMPNQFTIDEMIVCMSDYLAGKG